MSKMEAKRMRAKSEWRGGAVSGTVVSGIGAGNGDGGGAAVAIVTVGSVQSGRVGSS
jgi:hypothetical protein